VAHSNRQSAQHRPDERPSGPGIEPLNCLTRHGSASGQRHRASSHYASKWVVIIGRAPGCAARFASSKAARRCSGSSLSICPLAISKLETPYSPHFGQAMLTPSIVTSVSSALAPQTRQFIMLLCWLGGLGPEPSPSREAVNKQGRADLNRVEPNTRPARSKARCGAPLAARTDTNDRTVKEFRLWNGALIRWLGSHANGIPTRSPPQSRRTRVDPQAARGRL
jgi:hypothetical protein